MKDATRTEDTPHDRLTRIADAMADAMHTHPEHRRERCVVFLDDPETKRSGLVIHGYDGDNPDADAIADVLSHLQAMFAVNGMQMDLVMIPNSPEGL